jgi:hypothetical protein
MNFELSGLMVMAMQERVRTMKWIQWLFGTGDAGDKWSRDMMEDISAALLGLTLNEQGREPARKR